jgi:hypothetical protein
MDSKKLLLLGPGLLALLIAGGWGMRSRSAPGRSPAESRVPERQVGTAAMAPAPAPALSRSSTEANEALAISMLLSAPRQLAALSESRQREARERANRLAAHLRETPAAWEDLLDLLCLMQPEENAVALARLLAGAVDERSEPELLGLLKSGTRQARTVALALLASRKTSDTLAALQSAVEDPEPRLRLAALMALNERRAESREVVDAALARAARLDPDPILQDTARRLLGESVPSRYPAPIAHRSAMSSSFSASKRPAAPK